jgi:hypothetical protein
LALLVFVGFGTLVAQTTASLGNLAILYTGNTEVDVEYGFFGVDWDNHSAELLVNDVSTIKGGELLLGGEHVLRNSDLTLGETVTIKLLLIRDDEDGSTVISTDQVSTVVGEVAGNIVDHPQTRETRWTAPGPVTLHGNIVVEAGASLEIESGATVQLGVKDAENLFIGVNGSISSTGVFFNDITAEQDASLDITVLDGDLVYANELPNARVIAKGNGDISFTAESTTFKSLEISKIGNGSDLTGTVSIIGNSVQGALDDLLEPPVISCQTTPGRA